MQKTIFEWCNALRLLHLTSLRLAIKFIETELRAFSHAGWPFYLPSRLDHPIDMAASYFPAL